jgi:hypothetical protein
MNINRRDILKAGALGAAGMMIDPASLVAAVKKPVAKAKSVIQIWMWGGPTHLDTFDPKPEAGRDYCGPYEKPIETNVKGIRIGEMLPLMAKQADKYSIIRSSSHGINSHETASYLVQTGHEPGRLVYPSAGAVVSSFKGYKNGYKGIVPPYIVLCEPQGRFAEEGFLGPDYQPFSTGGDPSRTPFMVEGIVAKGITDERQRSRRGLMHKVDSLGIQMPEEEKFKDLDRCEDNAYKMMFGDARKLYDLSAEDEATRERYGMSQFGQSCLMARRLVEQGVPYVTINYKGWDTHKGHFNTMRQKLPELDKGFSTLLADLSARGLLDSTIVWWGGEFGRSPKIQWDAPWNGGRSHYGKCFSTVVAGGGFKGGHVVGASDATGSEPAERPVSPRNLLGSIYELMGIDPNGKLPNDRGMDLKVLADADNGDGRLREIM